MPLPPRSRSPRRPLLRLLAAALFVLPLALSGPTVASADAGDSATRSVVEPVRYSDHAVVRVHLHDDADVRLMDRLSVMAISCSGGPCPGDHLHRPMHDHVDYLVPASALPEMRAAGIHFDVRVEDIQPVIDAERARLAERDRTSAFDASDPGQVGIQGGPDNDPFFDDYQRFEVIDARLDALAALRPDLATVLDVGLSLEGRMIRAIRITGPGGGSDRPGLIINALQHAREWAAGSSAMLIADTLITQYGVDPLITSLVDTVDLYIVPVVNPDGYVYTWDVDRMWRKNRRNNGGGDYGVDLNRNWGVGWGGQGSSGDPGSGIYRGTAPFSEPETAAMRDFILARPNLAAHIDIHTYSQLVLQPWAYTTTLPPDHAILDEVGGRMASAMISLYGSFYEHGPGSQILYVVAGGSRDWTYGEQGMWGYGFELRDTGEYGFILPPDQIIPCGEEALAGALELAKFVRQVLVFGYPAGLPTLIDPDAPASIEVTISGNGGNTYQSGTARVYYREQGAGSFLSAPMTDLGNGNFQAVLPASPCGTVLEYYFEAETTSGKVARDPEDAPANFYSVDVLEAEVLFEDDFNSSLGWAVENIALADGPWERAIPSNFNRGDPPTDFDGSGYAFVTDNGESNSDVDGGPTIVTSPRIDLSSGDAVVSYARWFYNDDNDADRLTVQISGDDGQTWTTVESVSHTGRWDQIEFTVSDYITPTANVRLRFSAVDNPNNSVTEAGLDAVQVARFGCGGSPGMQLSVGTLSAGSNGQFDVTGARPDELTYLAYSLAGPGSTFVAPLNVTLDLAAPQQAGTSRRSDGTGSVSWQLPIPSGAQGRNVWFQACQFENVSNVVVATVQ